MFKLTEYHIVFTELYDDILKFTFINFVYYLSQKELSSYLFCLWVSTPKL